MSNSKKGRIVVFEGIDGCGKTTQAALAAVSLANRSIPNIVVRFPGQTTPLGKTVRELMTTSFNRVPPRAMTMLFAVDAVATIDSIIIPAVNAGIWILCDRWEQSAIVYNRVFKRFEGPEFEALNRKIFSTVPPDLEILFGLEPQVARERATVRLRNDSTDVVRDYDEAPIGIYRQLHAEYWRDALERKACVIGVNPAHAPEEIHNDQILPKLLKLL